MAGTYDEIIRAQLLEFYKRRREMPMDPRTSDFEFYHGLLPPTEATKAIREKVGPIPNYRMPDRKTGPPSTDHFDDVYYTPANPHGAIPIPLEYNFPREKKEDWFRWLRENMI